MLDEAIAERVRHLVAMPVPLAYLLRAVHGCGTRSIAEPARILAQPHRPTHVGYVLLRLHERDYRVSAIRRELAGVAVIESHDVPCELDNRHLHAEADAEKRQSSFARVPDRLDHSLHTAHAESAGHEQAVVLGEYLACALARRERVARD